MGNGTKPSGWVIIAALVAFGAFGLASTMFVTGDQALERLGLLFGMFGVIVVALVTVLKADAAAKQTETGSQIATALDGHFEERVASAVEAVLSQRSHNDRTSDR